MTTMLQSSACVKWLKDVIIITSLHVLDLTQIFHNGNCVLQNDSQFHYVSGMVVEKIGVNFQCPYHTEG